MDFSQFHNWRRRFIAFCGTIRFALAFYVAVAVIVSLVEYFKGLKPQYGETYFHYNNYLIFKYSLFNLLGGHDLYAFHPDQHFDLFKYSPSFPLFMAPMAYLPDWLGLMIWNALNTLPLFWAINALPDFSQKIRISIAWLISIDVMTNLHNAQSNGIMAALFIGAFVLLERKRIALAALCVVLMIYIKLFGLVALLLFALYPNRLKSAMAVLGWTLAIGLLPLAVASPGYVASQYSAWLRLLTTDHAANLGISLLGIVESWSGIHPPKTLPVLFGGILLALPLIRRTRFSDSAFRLLMLSSVLIWVVIFNHKAESPTFVIAACGVVVWYFTSQRTLVHHILFGLSLLLVTLSPTDIFPSFIRGDYIVPYKLKALPPVLIWIVLQYELIFRRYHPPPTQTSS